MTHSQDPTVCHEGYCELCGTRVHDRDNLDDDNLCFSCSDEQRANAEREEIEEVGL